MFLYKIEMLSSIAETYKRLLMDCMSIIIFFINDIFHCQVNNMVVGEADDLHDKIMNVICKKFTLINEN